MKRLLLAILTTTFILIGFVFYTTPETTPVSKKIEASTPAPPTPFDGVLREYETYINEALQRTGTPGAAVAIVMDSTIIYLKGFGVKNMETQKPVDVHTVFRLGSVSKPVAATLVGILAEKDILDLEDTVTHFLPDFTLSLPTYSNELKLKHVLSQSTGFPYHAYTNLIEEAWTLPTMVNELKTVQLIAKPGQVYSYQNVAYSLIDPIVAAASGHTFEDEIRSKLFGPLFMTDASVTYEALMKNENIAQPHLFRGKQWKPIPISETYYNAAPAGGINASITDMAKWMTAMLGYRPEVISPATTAEFFEPQVRATAKNRNFNRWSRIRKSYYGLGWRIINFKNDTLAYHGGYVNGFRSEVAIHPTRKIAICVLANGPSSFSDLAIPSFFIIYDKYIRPPMDQDVLAAP